MLLGAYLGALLIGAAANVTRLGALPALFFPLACVLLHLGYGSGSLIGLLRFAGRWGDRRGGQRTLVRSRPTEAPT